MGDKDTFSISGFPSFDDIEIEDEEKKPRNRRVNPTTNFKIKFDDMLSKITNIDPNEIVNLLPKELLENIKAEGEDPINAAKAALEGLKRTISEASDNLGNKALTAEELAEGIYNNVPSNLDDLEKELEEEDEEEYDEITYELGDISHLRPTDFGRITCIENENLVGAINERFNTKSLKNMLENGLINETAGIGEDFDFSKVDELELVLASKTFALYYVKPVNPKEYGVFIGIYEKQNHEFSMVLPEFRNSYNIDEDGIRLYNIDDDPEFFNEQRNDGISSFIPLNTTSLIFALKYLQNVINDKVYLSLGEAGVIKNVVPPISSDSKTLKIGNLIADKSNDKVLTLLKDAELDLNEESYPVYFNFGRTIDKQSLVQLSSILFGVKFNNCEKLKNLEVKYSVGKFLYVDIDLGDF